MLDDSIPRSIFLIVLVLAGGFFAGSETALSFCNPVRIRLLAENGDRRAKRLTWILNRFDQSIVTLLVAVNIIHVAAASIATVFAVSLMGPIGSVAATVLTTLVIFIFSETIPKNIARANSDSFAMRASLLIVFFIRLLAPVACALTGLGALVKKLLRISQNEPSVTEDEFASMVDDIQQEGLIDESEKEIIQSAIEFGDLEANGVMTPRNRIVAVPINASQEELKKFFVHHRFSRFPVYQDHLDQILGVVLASRALALLAEGRNISLRDLMDQPLRIPPSMAAADAFAEMDRHHTHLAIVQSQSGATLGIVTMADVLEALVGEVCAEDDLTAIPRMGAYCYA